MKQINSNNELLHEEKHLAVVSKEVLRIWVPSREKVTLVTPLE
jgi:hypothetical protein